MRRRLLCGVLLLLSAVALAQLPVVATTPVDAPAYNRHLRAADRAGAIWPRDPLLVARELIGGLGGRYLSFDKQEGADGSVIVTAIRDGLADEQLAGAWLRLYLVPHWREPAGEVAYQLWLVQRGEWAWRCQHGALAGVFAVEPCP